MDPSYHFFHPTLGVGLASLHSYEEVIGALRRVVASADAQSPDELS